MNFFIKSVLLVIFLTLISCKKEKSPTTISGKITTDCSGTSMANQPLELYAQGIRALGCGGGYYSFTTDDNGNFSVQNEDPIDGEELHIQYTNGGMSLIELTEGGDVNIGTLNINPTANYQLKIKVNNSFSLGDTLKIRSHNGGGPLHTLIAPFHDTMFPIVFNYQNGISVPNISNEDKVFVESFYWIYKYNGATYEEHKRDHVNSYITGCESSVKEILITIN